MNTIRDSSKASPKIAPKKKPAFNPQAFLDSSGAARQIVQYRRLETIYAQGGLKDLEIAQKLNVKEHSIRNYIYRIFEKLGVSSRVELILYVFSKRDNGS
jgi:DNA-binding NarL/FixJ family response regulator